MIDTNTSEHVITRKELVEELGKRIVQKNFTYIKSFLEDHQRSKYIPISVLDNQLHLGRPFGIALLHNYNPRIKKVNETQALAFIDNYLTVISNDDLIKFVTNLDDLLINEDIMQLVMNYALFTYLDTFNKQDYIYLFIAKHTKNYVIEILNNINIICSFLTKHPDKLNDLLEPLQIQIEDLESDNVFNIAPQEAQAVIWRLMELVTTSNKFTPQIKINNLFYLLEYFPFTSNIIAMRQLRLPMPYLWQLMYYISFSSYAEIAPHLHLIIRSKSDILWFIYDVLADSANKSKYSGKDPFECLDQLLNKGMTVDGCDKYLDYIDQWLNLIKTTDYTDSTQKIKNMVMRIFYPF